MVTLLKGPEAIPQRKVRLPGSAKGEAAQESAGKEARRGTRRGSFRGGAQKRVREGFA